MKVAVTGSTGHVGANVCRSLLKEGYAVKALYYDEAELSSLAGLNTENIKGNVLNKAQMMDFCQGVDVLVHLAAKISIDGDPDGNVTKVNVNGVENIVDACVEMGVKRLIHFSSIHAYKQMPLEVELKEDSPRVDETAFLYDQSKAKGEDVALKGMERGLEVIVLNPTGIIGPNDYHFSLMGKLFLDTFKKQIPAVTPGGFDWVDVRDVAQATVMAIKKGKPGEQYILSGKWSSIKDVIYKACEIASVTPPKVTVPFWLAKVGVPFARIQSKFTGLPARFTHESIEVLKISNKKISHEKAEKQLGFTPRPLEDSIRDIYTWFKKTGQLV